MAGYKLHEIVQGEGETAGADDYISIRRTAATSSNVYRLGSGMFRTHSRDRSTTRSVTSKVSPGISHQCYIQPNRCGLSIEKALSEIKREVSVMTNPEFYDARKPLTLHIDSSLRSLGDTDLYNWFFTYNVYKINSKLAEAGLRCLYWGVSLHIGCRRNIFLV